MLDQLKKMVANILNLIVANRLRIISAILIVLTIAAGAVCAWTYYQKSQEKLEEIHQAQIISQEQESHIKELKESLQVSQENATQLAEKIREIQSINPANDQKWQPEVTFTVHAPTIEQAAADVAGRVDKGDTNLPPQATEQTDRTIVTAVRNDPTGKELPPEEQRVDVYKINLNKTHRIKAGVTTMSDGQNYASIGYEQDRMEVLVHKGGGDKWGASIMYNIAVW